MGITKLIKYILFILISVNIHSQILNTSPELKPLGGEGSLYISRNYWVPVFAGLNTSNFMHSPYSNVWLTFDGNTRGQFMRVVSVGGDTAMYGTKLISATTDSSEIGGWIMVALPRKTGGFIVTRFNAVGWLFSFHDDFANTIQITHTGIGDFPLQVLAADDSLRRFIRVRINNLGAGGARLRFWSSTDGSDSLKIDSTNATWALAITSTTTALTFGAFNSQNNVSDTTQQTTATTTYFRGQLKDWYVRKWQTGTDSLYGKWKSPGFGQIVYDSSRIETFHWDRGNWSGTIAQQNFNIGRGLFGSNMGEVQMIRRKDPSIWIASGETPPTYIGNLGTGYSFWDSTANVNTHGESFTNASCIMARTDTAYVVIGGRLNLINVSTSTGLGDRAPFIARYNMVTGEWRPFNVAQALNSTVVSVEQINDSVMYATGLFTGAEGIALTSGLAQYNWNTNVWSTVDSSLSGGDGDGFRLYKSGNATFLGGAFTTIGATAGFGSVAIQRGYGTEWAKLGTGTTQFIYAFKVLSNGDTVVGGTFQNINSVECFSIAKWNGSTFVPYSTGIKLLDGTNGDVFDIEEYNGEMWVFGRFATAGGVACENVAKWNGSAWVNVGNIYRPNPIFRGSAIEATIDVTHNVMFIVGSFTKAELNGVTVTSYNNIAWNGQRFITLPPIDMRCEGVLYYRANTSSLVTADHIYIDGDETGAGGWDFDNGGSNGIHELIPNWTR